jgi:hypothetical protein
MTGRQTFCTPFAAFSGKSSSANCVSPAREKTLAYGQRRPIQGRQGGWPAKSVRNAATARLVAVPFATRTPAGGVWFSRVICCFLYVFIIAQNSAKLFEECIINK